MLTSSHVYAGLIPVALSFAGETVPKPADGKALSPTKSLWHSNNLENLTNCWKKLENVLLYVTIVYFTISLLAVNKKGGTQFNCKIFSAFTTKPRNVILYSTTRNQKKESAFIVFNHFWNWTRKHLVLPEARTSLPPSPILVLSISYRSSICFLKSRSLTAAPSQAAAASCRQRGRLHNEMLWNVKRQNGNPTVRERLVELPT